jgi:Zn-dependent peptidase ImmA (M78 family)
MFSELRAQAADDASVLVERGWVGWLPINPFSIARMSGVTVETVRLGHGSSGALVKEVDRDPRIVINAEDGERRRRFTCAHELGHFVLRTDALGSQRTDYRAGDTAKDRRAEEIYANEFAACLLMPEAMVRALHQYGLDDWEMAAKFEVSRSAMRQRLSRLQLS